MLKRRPPLESKLYVLESFVRGLAGLEAGPTGLEDIPTEIKHAADMVLSMSDAAFTLAQNNPSWER